MSTNYNEVVVLPYFQKRYQELLHASAVHEINFLVEQKKCQELEQKVAELTKKLESYSKKKKKEDEVSLDGQSY